MKKQYLLFLLALMLTQGLWAKPFEFGGLWYEPTSENTVKVVEESTSSEEGTSFSFRKCYEGDIVVPETVVSGETTYTVTAIGNGTFRESAKLTSVTLPATLTDLGDAPFADCPRLAAIYVAEENPAYTIVDGLPLLPLPFRGVQTSRPSAYPQRWGILVNTLSKDVLNSSPSTCPRGLRLSETARSITVRRSPTLLSPPR